MSKKIVSFHTLLFISHFLFAQKDTLQGSSLDPVIVTANKIMQKQSTTGKVITVISKEQIEKSNGKTVAQLLNEQAGVTINGSLNNAGTVQTIYVRGAASGRALILVDGIPINDPSMINNEFDLNLFSINDIERIEICKGAQSTLYGSDAIAGVINIITIKNNISAPLNFKTTLSGGSFETFKGNTQLYGKLGKFIYTARYARLYTQGFSSAYDSTGIKNFDKDGYDGNHLNASIAYQANQHLSFKTFAQYSQYKAGVDAGPFADKTNYNINNRNFTTGVGMHITNKIFSLSANYQYNILNRNYNDNASVIGATSWSLNNYNGVGQFAEVYANIKLGNGFSLLAGTDYRYSSMNNQYSSISIYGPYNSKFNDTGIQQTSFYSSVYYTYQNLNVEFGGRINHHSRYGTNYTYTFNPSYTINEPLRIFGSIASAFKAPSIYQLSLNNSLQPETSINYEAGLQWQKKIVNARLVYFNRVIDNGIDYNYITYNYFNYVKSVVNGLEFEITAKPTSQWNITANYTYLLPKVTTQNRATNKDTITYSYALRVPGNSLNITMGYQCSQQLFISLSGKYVSNRYDIGGYKTADIALTDYYLLNAYAEYNMNTQLKFFVNAQNITHQKFFDVRGYNSIPFLLDIGVSIHL